MGAGLGLGRGWEGEHQGEPGSEPQRLGWFASDAVTFIGSAVSMGVEEAAAARLRARLRVEGKGEGTGFL